MPIPKARPKEGCTVDRFLSKCAPEDEFGCVLWLAYVDGKGYSRFSVDGEVVFGHRFAYEAFVGPIPDGLVIDHLCRNRACVNPAHMEPVLTGENTRRGDMSAMGSHNRAKTHCPQGHPYDEANTGRCRGERYCRTCNRRGVAERRARKVAA